MQILTYFFWPRPPVAGYDNPKIQALLIASALFIAAYFALHYWRKRLRNSQTKKLSRSWAGACLSFGIIAAVLTLARAEDISYISMRFWWVLWLAALLFYVVLQARIFRTRHYKTLPRAQVPADPRAKYLPKKKK